MLNDRLAAHYGIPGVAGAHLRPVTLRPEDRRGGLLGQGSILSITSNGTRTSPVHRGAFILDNILDAPPAPPPADAGSIANKVPGLDKMTVREQLAVHRRIPTCADCHSKIDPLGFALENYGGTGRWRTREMSGDPNAPSPLGSPVDPSGEMPDGRAFRSISDFKEALKKDEDRFARTLCRKMAVYALGRGLGYGDREFIADLGRKLKAGGYRMEELIVGIVTSEPFRKK
jgi:hypothetical protein